MFLKKILLTSFFIALTALAFGCSRGLSPIEYNNAVVEVLNKTSASVQNSTTVYDAAIPSIVTETSTIDITPLQIAYTEMETHIQNASSILSLKSKNAEQETAVLQEFKNYLGLSQEYLILYAEMTAYYTNGTFSSDLEKVSSYDDALHSTYNELIDANNNLVDILSEYVQ
ncbi:MAG: hypothetical protein WC882_04805 [Candidatus Gracilibacteria bacterium]